MDILWMLLAWIIQAGLMLFGALRSIHALQLESYQGPGYLRWVKEHIKTLYKQQTWSMVMAFMAEGLAVICMLMLSLFSPQIWMLPILAVLGACWWGLEYWSDKKNPVKKPLVFTARIKRLLVILGVMLLVVAILAGLMLSFVLDPWWVVLITLWVLALPMPWWVYMAAMLAEPIEDNIKEGFKKEAHDKLVAREDLIRVGITGSYGKTSVKMILGTILSEKYKTFVTPHSYNTPMGVTRTVREDMPDDAEIFVAEMGARHEGDIREMCDLVMPTVGLITAVGPQHLETFGNIDRVAATKYELIENLPEGAFCAFPAENEYCLTMYRKTEDREKVLFASSPIEGLEEPLYLWAEDAAVSSEGSSFTLCDAEGGRAACTTRLLGRHNITNILCAACAAKHLGMSLEEIAAGIAKAEPVEHRLQIVPTDNGVTVIDDAFNASPDGTRAAMEVLASFAGRKIVVTPGLVELGDTQMAENIEFGMRLAETCDIAILVAGNGEAMQEGMLEAGFAEENIILTATLAEASEKLATLTRAGDVVLFENDLPDHYEA